MSSTSIFEKRWLDLVFEGRNKAYGAYQLRLENPKTTMLAFVYALLLIGAAAATGFLMSSFSQKPAFKSDIPPIINDSIFVTKVELEPRPTNPNPPKADVPKPKPTEPRQDWRVDPEVAPATQATSEPDNTPVEPVSSTQGEGTGISTEGENETGSAAVSGTGTENLPESPVIAASVDKQPSFPGGISKFYERVANSFKKPDVDEATTIRIIVSFVVEKNGEMSNIKVVNNPGQNLSDEAIRVLKDISKRKKWEPGLKNGKEVRTIFTLPIVIKAI